ncbi:hypothetical protein KXR53_09445 [Inquilinus limosus]|uniref:hypothetical protein n=1 Tax=Inquilinus limosus TaxID=171674 RepID=UPI003F147CE1
MATRNLEQDIDALTRTLAELRSEIGALAGDAARDAVDAGRRGARRVGRAADVAAEGIQGQVAERPLTSVGLAFAAGLAIGRFLVR